MEEKDPSSGDSYYYNERTGKTQWERPGKTSSSLQTSSALPFVEDWVEALDQTTGTPCKQCPRPILHNVLNLMAEY